MRILTTWILFAAILSGTGAASGAAPDSQYLLEPASEARTMVDGEGFRSREAGVLVDLSTAQDRFEVTLNAFDDVAVPVVLERIDGGSDANAWSGSVPGTPDQAVLIVEQEGLINGFAVLPAGTVALQSAGVGRVRIIEAASSDGVEHEPLAPPPLEPDLLPPAASRAGAEPLDVLVLYTPAVKAALNGEAAAQAFAATRIAELNLILDNSEIQMDARLAHAALISYNESGNSVLDLGSLREKGDGILDKAHSLRNLYGADVVTLLVENGGSVGYVMNEASSGFAQWAFSVVTLDMAATNFSMSHEIGHNLGSQHDRANAAGSGVFGYSYGHRVVGKFRTVMAYPCLLQGLARCDRQPYFSNPEVSFGGKATGVPIGANKPADNATGFDQVASVVTGFRDSVAPEPELYCDGELVTQAGGPENDVLTGTAGRDVIHGLGGNDTINGLGGNDVLCGGDGDDVIKGGGGKDVLLGMAGADDLRGGAGNDLLDGGGGNDDLRGEAGNDKFEDGPGADTVTGGAGADRFYADAGDDALDGGPGQDWIDHRRGDSAATVDLNAGSSSSADGGSDTLVAIERVMGSPEGDDISGDGARNVLKGGQGDDTIRGRGGDDTAIGNGGNDTLLGGGGDDLLKGGGGEDTVTGGPGTDACSGEHPATCES